MNKQIILDIEAIKNEVSKLKSQYDEYGVEFEVLTNLEAALDTSKVDVAIN